MIELPEAVALAAQMNEHLRGKRITRPVANRPGAAYEAGTAPRPAARPVPLRPMR